MKEVGFPIRWSLLPAASLVVICAFATGQTPAPPAALPPNPASSAPKFQPTPEQLGDSLMAHQRYQAAIEQYKLAPRTSADAWNKMGVAYQLMFNSEDAIRCYQTAIKISPHNAVFLNNLATVFVSAKQYANAERIYHKALKADPQSALVHKNLGTALLAEHKYKKGWEEYQSALAADPQIFEHNSNVRVENPASVQERGAMNYYMAKGCVRAGKNDCAIEYLRMALNEGFTNPKKISEDNEFAALRDMPAFQQLMAAQHTQ